MTEAFLSSSAVYAVGRLRHCAHSSAKGMHQGSHVSGRIGTSPDFSDFQPYAPGDDIRNVDWNVYARTEQLFIKRYMDERELRVSVILDASRSMAGGRWLMARRLCAVLGMMALAGDDHLRILTVGATGTSVFSDKGVRHRNRLLSHLEHLPLPEATGFAESASMESMPGASVQYIVTDALERPESFRPLFRKLRKSRGEIRLILLTDGDPTVRADGSDVRLIDAETGESVDVRMTESSIQRQRERRHRHFSEFASLCKQFGVSVLEAAGEESAAQFATRQMRRAGWVR